MTGAERVRYLANLLHAVEGRAARGAAAPLLRRIAEEIGAGAEELAAAEAVAGAPGDTPAYPARYSDRVRNVEDLLLVAMLDERFSPGERKVILEAQRAVGIDPAAWSRIAAECRARMAEYADRSEFAACARRRRDAAHPDRYCHGAGTASLNVFGCLELKMEWSGFAVWLGYGSFEPDGTFVFDKARIGAEIDARAGRLSACPHFDAALARAAVEALPERVKPGADPGWEYRRSFVARPGCHTYRESVTLGSFREERELYADGVKPVGEAAAGTILAAARAAAGRPPLPPV